MILAHYQIVVLVIVAIGIQFASLGAALMLEFSDRKRRLKAFPLEVQREAVKLKPIIPPSKRRAAAKVTQLPRPAPLKIEPEAPAPEPGRTALEPEAGLPEPQTRPVRAALGPEPAQEIEKVGETAEAAVSPESEVQLSAEIPELAPPPEMPELTPPETQPIKELPARLEEFQPAVTAKKPVPIGFGLRKTRETFLKRIRAAITGSARVEEIYDGLEEALIGADVGVDASVKIVGAVREKLKNDSRPEAIREALKAEIEAVLTGVERALSESGDEPFVIMLAGVNGVGKTTTIAKLAAMFKAERGDVLVAAADTFRAAAIEQLEVWCDRAGAGIIKQKQGSDPAAVAFDAVKAARARKAKTVLIDTAGRLQTKVNLMEELKKIARVAGRELPGAPHETWLVLDATTGQNALSQARIFGEAVKLTGVVLAKLDSTAKGGVVVGIAEQLKLPVRYVGVGENLEDLKAFDAREFVEALFETDERSGHGDSGSYAA
ncbi:MAG: signal recognition particle-docking protein FtsY [Candidatus Binataceae bacterium]